MQRLVLTLLARALFYGWPAHCEESHLDPEIYCPDLVNITCKGVNISDAAISAQDCEHEHEEHEGESAEEHAGHADEGAGESAQSDPKDLLPHQLASIFLNLISSIIGIVLRLCCRIKHQTTVISFVNVFVGGMFVSLALFHILPETIAIQPVELATIFTEESSSIFIMLLAFIGYIIVVFIERVLFAGHSHGPSVTQKSAPQKREDDNEEVIPAGEVDPTPDHVCPVHGAPTTFRLGVLLMIVLSVHSVFEGAVIGTAGSVISVWILTVVAVAHQWAAAFAVANRLAGGYAATKGSICLLAALALSTPFGISLGMVISNVFSGFAAEVGIVVINSVGAGTLLYIGMTEIVPEEFKGSRVAALKFLLFVVAAGAVCALSVVETQGHDHSHGHEEGHGLEEEKAGCASEDTLSSVLPRFCKQILETICSPEALAAHEHEEHEAR